MIRRHEFEKIEYEVQSAVKQAFEFAKENQKNPNDFILFLSNCHLMENSRDSQVNPYLIDYQMDYYNDEVRLSNLVEYFRHSYSFHTENTADSKLSISFELMIYTHMWESKPYLKLLKKLADLCDTQDYNWNVEIPDMGKHNFIRNDLRAIFKTHNLDISKMIKNGFHSSLRNAFAHSDYTFDLFGPKISLLNYKHANWELKEISFDDWTKRFCYTFLLGLRIQERFYKEKQELNHGEPGYQVLLKDKDGNKFSGIIYYNKTDNSFSTYPPLTQ